MSVQGQVLGASTVTTSVIVATASSDGGGEVMAAVTDNTQQLAQTGSVELLVAIVVGFTILLLVGTITKLSFRK